MKINVLQFRILLWILKCTLDTTDSNAYVQLTFHYVTFSFKNALTCRQKLRKYVRNEFEKDVEKFRENPDEPDDLHGDDEEEGAKDSDAR